MNGKVDTLVVRRDRARGLTDSGPKGQAVSQESSEIGRSLVDPEPAE